MTNIIIYRHQLFNPSEGFIAQQTRYLQKFEPLYVGRTITGELPNDDIKIRTIQAFGNKQIFFHTFLRYCEPLKQALQLDNPTLIHAHFGVEGVYALPLSKKLNIPLITTFHGFDATCSHRGLLLSRKVSWLNYLAFRHQLKKQGALFIAVSDFIREKLLQLGFPEQRIKRHYIGVDIDKIKPSLQLKKNKFILHVARLVEVKGTRYLLEAFSTIHKQHSDVVLVIIGEGPLGLSLQHYAESLGIASHVQFLGALPHQQVIEYMQQASIFCVPSQTTTFGNAEGLGMVFLEASACEIPIVATRHGGIPEAVHDNETGFLVPEKDSDALAERLSYLLANESLCLRIGKAGRILAEKQFDLRAQTRELEEIYTSYI